MPSRCADDDLTCYLLSISLITEKISANSGFIHQKKKYVNKKK